MYNYSSLLTAIKKLVSSIALIQKENRLSPIIGFIDSKVYYLTDEIIVPEIMLESAYKKVNPKLQELINKIPSDKQAVISIAQSALDNDTLINNAFTKDNFPYTLLVKPEIKENNLSFKIKIVVAYAKIKSANIF